MNYTQNQKIEQVTESTLVLGVDIGSSEHYVRAFDYRGRELTRKVFRFSTDINGFNSFYDWVTQICIKHGKNEAMIGCEPTGHYWYTFYQFVKDHGMKLAFVNPASVKKAKELDDNSPKKTDLKDPKTIAKLVIDGRYSFPYVPEGIYAEIREVTSSRDRIMKELNAASNRIQRWLKIYFPEYLTVYKKFDTTTGMMILEEVPLPTMVTALGVDNIIKIWREHKVRGKGASFNRAKTLVDAAHDSVGKSGGQGAVMEIQMLLEDYKVKKQQLEMVTSVMEELIMQIPNAEKMLSVDGVGLVTGGDVLIKNVIPKHLEAITAKLTQIGCEVAEFDDAVRVVGYRNMKYTNVKTLPYPGFPTDVQPQITVVLALAKGTSIVTEGIFENRFKYVDELAKMGADITVEGNTAIVKGVERYTGAEVTAPDLRAGAALVLAGLAADGITVVDDIKYILRGYEDFDIKLRELGAKIEYVQSEKELRKFVLKIS